VFTLQDFDEKPSGWCLYVWGRTIPMQQTVTYDVDRCASAS